MKIPQAMLEFIPLRDPTEEQVRDYSARLAQEATKGFNETSRPNMQNAFSRIYYENMTRKKLLLVQHHEVPIGFVSYSVQSINGDIGQQSKLFEYADLRYSPVEIERRLQRMEELRASSRRDLGSLLQSSGNDPRVERKELRTFAPFNEFSHSGVLLTIHYGQVVEHQKGQGIGRQMFTRLIEGEMPEIMEGLAEPSTLGFFVKQGFEVLPLYAEDRTAIAWYNHTYRLTNVRQEHPSYSSYRP